MLGCGWHGEWIEKRERGEEMLIRIEGKKEVLKDLEEAQQLINKARDILYRTPTQIKIAVEECDSEINDSQDTQ